MLEQTSLALFVTIQWKHETLPGMAGRAPIESTRLPRQNVSGGLHSGSARWRSVRVAGRRAYPLPDSAVIQTHALQAGEEGGRQADGR